MNEWTRVVLRIIILRVTKFFLVVKILNIPRKETELAEKVET